MVANRQSGLHGGGEEEMRGYKRTITRIIWNLEKAAELTKLPILHELGGWYGDFPYLLERIFVELASNKGKIWLKIWREYMRQRELEELLTLVVDRLKDLMNGDVVGQRDFVPGALIDKYPHRGEILVTFEARNGEHITDTAIDRCITIFECLGAKIADAPLIGKFDQIQYGSRDKFDWTELGLIKYHNHLCRRGIKIY